MSFALLSSFETGTLIDINEILASINSPLAATQGLFEVIMILGKCMRDPSWTWDEVQHHINSANLRHENKVFRKCLQLIGVDPDNTDAIEKLLKIIDMRGSNFRYLENAEIKLPNPDFIYTWKQLIDNLVPDPLEDGIEGIRDFLTLGQDKQAFIRSVTSIEEVSRYHGYRQEITKIYGPEGLGWLDKEDCLVVLKGFDLNKLIEELPDNKWLGLDISPENKQFFLYMGIYGIFEDMGFTYDTERNAVLSEAEIGERLLLSTKERLSKLLDATPTILSNLAKLAGKYYPGLNTDIEKLVNQFSEISTSVKSLLTDWDLFRTDALQLANDFNQLWSPVMEEAFILLSSVIKAQVNQLSPETIGNKAGYFNDTRVALSKIANELNQFTEPRSGNMGDLMALSEAMLKYSPKEIAFITSALEYNPTEYTQAVGNAGVAAAKWLRDYLALRNTVESVVELLLAYQAVGPLMPKETEPEA